LEVLKALVLLALAALSVKKILETVHLVQQERPSRMEGVSLAESTNSQTEASKKNVLPVINA
jgi:hypothetical protein